MARAQRQAAPATPSKSGRGGRQQQASSGEHGVKDITTALAAIPDWANTEEKKFGEVDDGQYQVQIDEATINHSKSSGRLQVSWQATIQSGVPAGNEGRKVFWHDGIDDAENRSWFRGKLARLGIEWPTDPKELPDVLESLKESFAEVKVKTKGEFQNFNIVKAIDGADVETTTTETTTEPEPTGEAALTQNEASFSDGNLTDKMKERILKLASKVNINPEDYAGNEGSKYRDILLDLADHYELGPVMWEDPQELIDAVIDKV